MSKKVRNNEELNSNDFKALDKVKKIKRNNKKNFKYE